jgi:hypothetical protein
LLSKTTNPRVEKHPTQAFLCKVDNLLPPDWLIVSCDRSGQYRIWRVLFHPRLPWPSKQIMSAPTPLCPKKAVPPPSPPPPGTATDLPPPPTCTLLRQQTLLCCSSPNLTLQPAKLSFLLLLLLYCRRSSFKIHAEIYYNYRIYV